MIRRHFISLVRDGLGIFLRLYDDRTLAADVPMSRLRLAKLLRDGAALLHDDLCGGHPAAPPPMQRLVILESPYSGDVEANVAYARACICDCLRRGEAPIASHLLFTQPGVLDDAAPAERAQGIAAGHAWFRVADACVVYEDRGFSVGMIAGVEAARAAGVPIEFRSLEQYRLLRLDAEARGENEAGPV